MKSNVAVNLSIGTIDRVLVRIDAEPHRGRRSVRRSLCRFQVTLGRYTDRARPCGTTIACLTLSYMKSATLTIRLDAKLERELNRLSRQLGRSRSELVRDALRRQLALARFEQARRALLPLAETQGLLTDEDVFADVS